MDENLRKRKSPGNSTISSELDDSLILIDEIDNEPLEKHQKLCENPIVDAPNPTCEDAQINESTNEVILIENDEEPPQVNTCSESTGIGASQQSSGFYSQETPSSIDITEEDAQNQVLEIIEDAEDDKLCASQSTITIEDEGPANEEIIVLPSEDSEKSSKTEENLEIPTIVIENLDAQKPVNDSLDGASEIPLNCVTETTINAINPPVLEDGELNDETKSNKPSIEINFLDKTFADKYKLKFLNFLKNFTEFKLNIKEDLSIKINSDTSLNPKDWIALNDSSDVDDSSPSKKRKKGKELFVLDTSPTLTTKRLPLTKYEPKFLLADQPKGDENEQNNRSKGASTCFNCGKDHALKDCTEEKDFRKIAAARQQFRTNNKNVYV